jgi:hypothetical protein
MNFNELPIEIIQIIFYIHVHQHIGSKCTLLRTCRTWYNVASNYAMLWRAIHHEESPGFFLALGHSHPSTTIHRDDRCLNLDDLAQDIRRTGTITFDLAFQFPAGTPSKIDLRRFSVEVDPNWLARCRSLSLYQPDGFCNSFQRTVDSILLPTDRDFPSLEKFSISELGVYPWDGALDMFFSRVADSSSKLQYLELTSRFESGGIELRVFRFPDILYSIRRLQLKSIACIPWADLPNLEHLDYAIISGSSNQNLSQLVAPRLTSLCLEGGF